MSKKGALFFGAGFLGLSALLPLISAFDAGYFFTDGMTKVIDGVKGFSTPLFEALIGDYSSNEFFFAKVLLMILLFITINAVLRKIPLFEEQNKKGVAFIIALVVSILAVRFISENELTLGILVPYGALGVALTTILPALICAYAIYFTNMGGLGRRLCWIFLGIVYLVLWLNKSSELSSISNQIYIFTLIVIVILFFADRQIASYFHAYGLNRYFTKSNRRNIAHLKAEYATLAASPGAAADKDIQRRLKEIATELRVYHPGWHP